VSLVIQLRLADLLDGQVVLLDGLLDAQLVRAPRMEYTTCATVMFRPLKTNYGHE
jgi:hypothetical protein